MLTENEHDEAMADPGTPTSHAEDQLGYELQKKFESWKTYRLLIEAEWEKDLRAYNQQNDDGNGDAQNAKAQPVTTYHRHIFSAMARSRADTAYARIIDPLFMGAEKHWGIGPTPMPSTAQGELPDIKLLQAALAQQAEAMEKEMADQHITMGYEDKLKAAIKEATVLGTGVVKGVVPGVKKREAWKEVPMLDELGAPMLDTAGQPVTTWDMVAEEVPYPSMGEGNLSIFDVFPDPYATRQEDMSGCFQRHVMTRGALEDLMDDEQFDKEKIRQILADHQTGNHVALPNEVKRRSLAKVSDTSGSMSGRFDVLEYWGEVNGRLLKTLGIDEMDALEDSRVYFCCVWTCAGHTILARLAPMKRQRVPYRFFKYADIPHQFWGIGPVRMVRLDALPMQNAAMRALCDDLTLNTLPMREVNANMLRDKEDPRGIGPGHVFVRDKGDPAEPAVRFYQAASNVRNIVPILDLSRRMMDDSTNMPSYTQGIQIKGANETASGTSMLMGAANVTLKAVIKNLEDGIIRPFIQSQYDWNMQWNPRADIKGDMEVNVKGLTALTSKEVQSQRLTQFLTQTANPLDASMVDRRYLLREAARALEIDPDKAVPEPEQQTTEMMYGQGTPQPVDATQQPPGMGGAGGAMGGAPPPPDYPGNGNQFVG